MLGRNGILADFDGRVGFDVAVMNAREQQRQVQEASTTFFILPIFVLLGMTVPWEGGARVERRGPGSRDAPLAPAARVVAARGPRAGDQNWV
jgi:NhaP-type Na+/H+ or K+/H+ antiporter